jgi:hypothetical protein
VNEKGEQQRLRWYVACLDSPYRQYVLGMMDEIFSRYQVDELFLDIFGIQFVLFHGNGRNPFCFCKYTQEAWNQEHPGDSYAEGFNILRSAAWKSSYVASKADDDRMLEEITPQRARPAGRPDIPEWRPEVFPDELMKRVSFIYAEPLSCPYGNFASARSILMRGWGRSNYQAGSSLRRVPGYLSRSIEGPGRCADRPECPHLIVGNAPIVSDLDSQDRQARFAVAKETWPMSAASMRFGGNRAGPQRGHALQRAPSRRTCPENRPVTSATPLWARRDPHPCRPARREPG